MTNEATPREVGLSEGLGPTLAHPPLPTPAAWNCYWKGDNDGPSWDQWHDASDPMPERWEGSPPDDVVPHFTAAQVLEYAETAMALSLGGDPTSAVKNLILHGQEGTAGVDQIDAG